MDLRKKQIIRTNEKYLRDNIISDKITPNLISDQIISIDDDERIEKEVTASDKVRRLLRIVEMHPNGYKSLTSALMEEGMGFIADTLETTAINEEDIAKEQNEWDIKIKAMLRKKLLYHTESDVLLTIVEDVLREEFRKIGECYNVHGEHLRRLVTNCFPQVTYKKSKKKKEWRFYNLSRKHDEEDDEADDDDDSDSDNRNSKEDTKLTIAADNRATAGVSVPFTESTCTSPTITNRKQLQHLSPAELADMLTQYMKDSDLPDSVTETIRSEGVSGKMFKRLDRSEHVKTLFPDFSKVQTLSLMYLREDICRAEDEFESNSKTHTIAHDEPATKVVHEEPTATSDQDTMEYVGHFRETFRQFDKESKTINNYRQHATLTSFNTRPSNLIDPVHVFSHPLKGKISYSAIGHEIAEFAAACMNSRSNGTIHFGIKSNECDEYQIDGEVIGMPLNREVCLNDIYQQFDKRFYKEQKPIVLKCIRPPQFIQVTTTVELQEKLWVLEVDIVPLSTIIGDEAFFTKQRSNDRPVLFLFDAGRFSPKCISDEESQAFMSKYKNKYTEMRKTQEMTPKTTTNKDLRQNILELLCSGDESMTSDTYPLLFLGRFDSSSINNVDFEHFQFMIDLDANAIFDFDYSTGCKGIFQFFENDKEQVMKALTTDNFDPNSEENQIKKESHSNLLDDIRMSVIKPWVFCNGYEPLSKLPMKVMDWKQKRSTGFKEAIRFYRQEIPSGRGLVIFFLFSKDYEEMLEAANDVIIEFKDQWVVFAENDAIARHWCTELSSRHIADKKTVDRRTIVGMPWKHVNQTLQQLTTSKHSMRCEIPTSTGAFCHLKAKKKNELYDLEILSKNECDNDELTENEKGREQVRREEEERFYKGGNVSWWNFWFPGHVLKRDVHRRIKDKVIEALEGKSLDDDNKIGLVNIFHQPGSGGSTTAKHILWDLKVRYRCCIVKQITDQTVDQITSFRNYEENEDPKPPLVLVENKDEERVAEMCAVLQHRARIVARRNTDVKVFCVLLLCTRRANIPQIDKTSEALKHELSSKELQWFSNKYRDLEKQFKAKIGPDPRFLISFNILKENFNSDYIRDTAAELVKGVTNSNEQKLLKYLSLLNTFDLEGLAIPVSAFDPIMRKYRTVQRAGRHQKELNKTWEQTISQPLQILINRNVRAGFGSQLQALSIINAVFAEAILKCFTSQQKLSEIVFELFMSQMVLSNNMSRKELEKVIKNIMKKREDKDDIGRMKFSPLIMRLLEDENEETATKVLKKGFDMTDDPMICQQVARLYIHCKNWKEAAHYAKIATDMKPYNSFLWDTYGQVYIQELFSKYEECVQEVKNMSPEEIERVIEIAQNGIHKFQKEQEVSDCERSTKVNDAGYFNELRITILLLDTLCFSPLGNIKANLHTYLVHKDYVPEKMPPLKSESKTFLKSLEQNVERTMKMIEDKTTQFKDDKMFAVFNQQDSWRKGLYNLRENLDSYFGEDSDIIPEYNSENEKVDFRRRRVKRLGGRTLYNLIRIADKKNLKLILGLLMDNMESDYWEPFDAVCLINVVLAMKILKIEQSKVTYHDLVVLSQTCYKKVTKLRHSYLEAYMYYIVFNWPTETRQSQSICRVEELKEAVKNWKAAFHLNHPRQKDGTPARRRETTIFFLGRGKDMDSVVHYDELVDPRGKKFAKGDTVWESEDFINKLLRLPGTLVNDGSDVSYQMEQRAGGIIPFNVPTSFPIGNRLLWQKRVMFVLGFSWGGIKAYDVRQNMPEVPINPPIKPTPSGTYQSTTRKQQIQTHESFMQQLRDLTEDISSEKRKLRQKMNTERKRQQEEKIAKLEKKKEELLKSRGELFGT